MDNNFHYDKLQRLNDDRYMDLCKEVDTLYKYVGYLKKQKDEFMDRAWISFLCFLMLSASGFILGLLVMFWRWLI